MNYSLLSILKLLYWILLMMVMLLEGGWFMFSLQAHFVQKLRSYQFCVIPFIMNNENVVSKGKFIHNFSPFYALLSLLPRFIHNNNNYREILLIIVYNVISRGHLTAESFFNFIEIFRCHLATTPIVWCAYHNRFSITIYQKQHQHRQCKKEVLLPTFFCSVNRVRCIQ